MMGAFVGRNFVMLRTMPQREHGQGWHWSQQVLGQGPWAKVVKERREDRVLVLEQAKEGSPCQPREGGAFARSGSPGPGRGHTRTAAWHQRCDLGELELEASVQLEGSAGTIGHYGRGRSSELGEGLMTCR
jgi:hypothetical protein